MDEKNDIEEEINLPFSSEKFDFAVWLYDHSEGVFISVIIYLVILTLFVFARITIESRPVGRETLAISIEIIEELEQQRNELIESIEEQQPQPQKPLEKVANEISNEEMEEDEEELLSEEDLAEIEQMIANAANVQEQIDSNRRGYEQGLAEIEQIRSDGEAASAATIAAVAERIAKRRDRKVSGNVVVSYSVINPIRHAQHLTVPAYTCEGGGEVVISITVSKMGKVESAKVLRGGDECMQQAAISSALQSTFNIDHRASARQEGKITYKFIPQ